LLGHFGKLAMTILNKKIKGIIQLFRPELPFSAGVCVVLGEIVALGSFPSIREATLGFVCGFFISGSALVSNDYFDLEVDKINAPQRPLPSGMVSPTEALILAAVAMLIGLAASYAVSIPALILSIVFGAVGVLYNWRYKQAGLLGNLMVASSVGITFILGGLAVDQPFNPIVWFFSLTAFLIDFGEEIAGDAMDIEGDKKRDSKSIAILRGKKFALRISGGAFLLVFLISFIPYFMGWLGLTYLVTICLANVITLFSTVRLLRSQTPEDGRKYMRFIYIGATFGMLAYIIAQFFA
jgi:geranylgeranylglycerol-phosphate geranylgeranyltransferase